QHHHLAGGQLISLGDVGVGHLLAVDRTDPPVADAPAVGAVDLVEGHVLLLGGRIELHRDHDQPEGDRARPDAAHRLSLPTRRTLVTILALTFEKLHVHCEHLTIWPHTRQGVADAARFGPAVTRRGGWGVIV